VALKLGRVGEGKRMERGVVCMEVMMDLSKAVSADRLCGGRTYSGATIDQRQTKERDWKGDVRSSTSLDFHQDNFSYNLIQLPSRPVNNPKRVCPGFSFSFRLLPDLASPVPVTLGEFHVACQDTRSHGRTLRSTGILLEHGWNHRL
jgi:hypothetical protein